MSKIRQKRLIPSLTALPRPVYARAESWSENGSQTDWHCHPWGQLSYALSGILIVNTRRGRYVAPPQYAIWLPPQEQHEVVSGGAAVMRSLYVDSSQLLHPRWQQPLVCEITPLMRELIIRFSANPAEYLADTPAARLAQVLLDQLAELPSAPLQLPMPQDRRLQRLCQQLQQTDDNVPLAQLALSQGLSDRSISRLFKEETGMTFRQWRRSLRLFKGLEALRDGTSVTTVALDCGYDSVSAFVAAFREQFGKTPGQYFKT
ncbi:helix-turn-helix transcriptional regulator [Shewanella yunxiaonensis]|uniref:Helix-turn-helix transcriptional regulator n=1 Tax=Shewanella yunxiaonensis TaxID=2829809 RepID=A0ABX7YXV2_9GAMM|nr:MULTISPECIES: helix-turn-helix transcriptional regulator [Shewanella]MDF0534332.1 helix-turn-helix transcriptional regulator [Shewanella sp. A32]QUN07114.1 helix-turn-helix transcriptional regulator [Shewanella yunxiaonensis]